MERRLNSRTMVLIAWITFGLLLAGGAGFGLYLIAPAAFRGSSPDTSALEATATVMATSRPITGRAIFSGAIERIEGQALLVRGRDDSLTRVVVRNGATVGRITAGDASDMQPGSPAAVTLARQQDQMVVVSVRLQPPGLPPGGPVDPFSARGSSSETETVTGIVAGLDAGTLRLTTDGGERALPMAASVRVRRFDPVNLSELEPGRRITIDGERLIDGSVAATSVQVIDSRQ